MVHTVTADFSGLRLVDHSQMQLPRVQQATSAVALSAIDESVIPRPGRPVTGHFLRKYTHLFSEIARFLDPTPDDFFNCFHVLPQMNNATYSPEENPREDLGVIRFQDSVLAASFVRTAPHILIQCWLKETPRAPIHDRI